MPFHLPRYARGWPTPGPKETVALLAGLMALNAFAIDAMIPALPEIGSELGVGTENHRQLVVVTYFLGFGVGQIFWGTAGRPLRTQADPCRRSSALRRLCPARAELPQFRASDCRTYRYGRLRRGHPRAASWQWSAICSRARRWPEVMSLVFMVFMLVPMLAPNIGQS